MKIIRHLTPTGTPAFAEEISPGIYHRLLGNLVSGWKTTSEPVEVTQLLAPIEPPAILCVGLNYRQHAAETHAPLPAFPVLFFKNPSSLQHPGRPIEIPTFLASAKVDFECELVVVIAKTCKNVARENAYEFIAGYTCGNDVSARDWQKEGGGTQWCRGKSFDTFAPLGPCLVTPDEIPDPHGLAIRTLVNGETMQTSSTADLIFDVPALIEFLSGSTTLLSGTAIFTGTPHGVGMARNPPRYLQPGDHVTVEIERIGALTNPVVAEQTATRSSFHL